MQAKLFLNQTFDFGDISATETPTNLILSAEEMVEIEKKWQELKTKADQQGKEAWDGMTYRLNSYSVEGVKLHLDLAELSFRVRHAVEQLQNESEREDISTNGLCVSPLVETTDGLFLFGKLSGKSLSDRVYGAFGGILSKDDHVVTSGEDIWNMFLQELREEAGILPGHIKEYSMEGLARSIRGVVLIIGYIRLNITASEAEKVFVTRTDHEMSEMIAITREELAQFPAFKNYQKAWEPVAQRLLCKSH